MKMLFLLMFFMTGCMEVTYESETPYANIGIDDEFHTRVLYFEEVWGHQVTNTSMIFVDSLGQKVLADAISYSEEMKGLVRVDKSKWLKNQWDAYKTVIILHELGHAVLLRDHTPQPEEGEEPTSLMQPILTSALIRAFERDPQPFLDELFERHPDSASLTWECHN